MVGYYNELRIRLSDIVSNALYFGSLSRISAVLKANAYGLGVEPVGRALLQSGVREFYVFTLDEAIELRQILGNDVIIYFFAGLRQGEDAILSAKHKLIPVLNRLPELHLWEQVAWQGKKPLCVQVDTGMNRLGLSMADWHEFLSFYRSGDFSVPLVLSHLACADEKEHAQNKKQLDAVQFLLRDLPEAELSLSATNGAFLDSGYHGNQLRIGVGLYGVVPIHSDIILQNPLLWRSEILQIRTLDSGDFIGYGATSVGDSRQVAIMSCGYADGLRRNFSDRGEVYVNGIACRMLGRISMDCSAVDVSGIEVSVGDDVEIIGEHQSLQAVADSMETIAYEVLCGIGDRVKRNFID